MKILFVEDDQHTRDVISATLIAHRYAVDVVADGEAGLEMAIQWSYDLILLDVMLPKLSGIEVCRRLRTRGCQTPILMLTTKGSSEDVILGLDAGADDYVAKSCDYSQLLARVRALLRRGSDSTPTPLLTWGGLTLDPASAQVFYGQQIVPCRPKEYALLELFLRNPQRLLSRSHIIDHLWSFDDAPVEGSVTTLIKDLRRRFKAIGMAEDPIETVYGLGYRLKAPQNESKPPAPDHPAPAEQASWADSPQQRLQLVIQQAGAKFRASLDQRIAVLEAAERSFQAGEFSLEQQQEVFAHVHTLAGGLGTFGYGKASEVAEALEQTLAQQIGQEQQWAHQFSQLLTELRQELAQVPTQNAEIPLGHRQR